MTAPSGRQPALRHLKIATALILLVATLAYATVRHAPRWEEQAEVTPSAPTADPARSAEPAGAAGRAARQPIGPGLRPSPEKRLPVDHSSFGRTARKPADAPAPLAEAPALDEAVARPTLLPRPLVLDSGSFRVGSGTIRLSGIEPATESCGSGATLWPCGARARTALRALVRSRSVTCTVPGHFQTKDDTVESACRLGVTDIGQWLVENGWAKAAAGGPYAEAESRARAARAGIWAERAPSTRGGLTSPAVLPAPPQ